MRLFEELNNETIKNYYRATIIASAITKDSIYSK